MTNMRCALTLFITAALACLHPARAAAQTDDQYRMEIGAGVGLMTYEGDYNGSLFSGMQPQGTVMLRRLFNPYTGLRLAATYGRIKGGADKVKTWYPNIIGGTSGDTATGDGTGTGDTGGAATAVTADGRSHYEFSRSLMDLSLTFEYNFWPYGTGRDYRGAKRLTPFVFGGLGLTVASGGDGGTAFTGSVPVGLGIKYKVAPRVNLGLEWAVHFSLSDKLDGYKDPYGVQSSGLFKNTDCFSALQLSITYSFMPKCRTCHNQDE